MTERHEVENDLLVGQSELLLSHPEVIAWLERLPLRTPVDAFELGDGSD